MFMVIGPFGSGSMPGNVLFPILLVLPLNTRLLQPLDLCRKSPSRADTAVTPIFVFDGPEHPNVKRDKIVRGNDHWLVDPFKEMLDGYGFRHSAVRDVSFYIHTTAD